jgi:hypothetical protein
MLDQIKGRWARRIDETFTPEKDGEVELDPIDDDLCQISKKSDRKGEKIGFAKSHQKGPNIFALVRVISWIVSASVKIL